MANQQEVVLRSPSGEEVRTSDLNEIREYENNGYVRVDDDENDQQ